MKCWKILIVEQAQDGRNFNRGAVLNAGFHYLDNLEEEFDQVMLHDADLLAADENTRLWYAVDVPKGYIVHLSAVGYPKHNGENKIPGAARGVVVLGWDDFKRSNGFPLDIWGYAMALEDRIWADRLGANRVRYYQCPIGSWDDLDAVDLQNPRNFSRIEEDLQRWYDERFLTTYLAQDVLIKPMSEKGELAAGPEKLQGPEDLWKTCVVRTGGLDTMSYKVLDEDITLVHASLIRVLLDLRDGHHT